jgi:hypothetical protein
VRLVEVVPPDYLVPIGCFVRRRHTHGPSDAVAAFGRAARGLGYVQLDTAYFGLDFCHFNIQKVAMRNRRKQKQKQNIKVKINRDCLNVIYIWIFLFVFTNKINKMNRGKN